MLKLSSLLSGSYFMPDCFTRISVNIDLIVFAGARVSPVLCTKKTWRFLESLLNDFATTFAFHLTDFIPLWKAEKSR